MATIRKGSAATAVACAAMLCVTAACSSSSGGGGSGSSNTASGPATVTLMTWETAGTNGAIDKALAGFKDPNITVKRIDTPGGAYGDKLASLTQAKKLPDLFWCGNDTEQQDASQGLLMDWSSKLKAGDDAIKASDFVPVSVKNWTTADGKMGGLPSLLNTYGVWYNADAFKAAGLTAPAAGWTYDQMYADAQKLAHKNGASYGLYADAMVSTDGPFSMGLYSTSAGGAAFTDNVNAPTEVQADAKFTEGVTKLSSEVQAGVVAPPGFVTTNEQSLFAAGKVPMMYGGQWLAAGFATDKPKIKYGFVPFPQVNTPTALADSVGVCTPSYTQSSDATYKVLAYLNATVWGEIAKSSAVAAPAYVPAQTAYYQALTGVGQNFVADTVRADLAMTSTVGNRFTTPWASQAADLTTADYLPILAGKKPVSDLPAYIDKINALIKSNG